MTFGPFGPLQMTFSSPDSAGQQHPHQFPDCMRFCASQTVGSTIVWPQNVRSCQNTIILAQNVPLRKNQNVVSLKAKTLFQHVWVLRSFLALPKTHCTCLGDVVLWMKRTIKFLFSDNLLKNYISTNAIVQNDLAFWFCEITYFVGRLHRSKLFISLEGCIEANWHTNNDKQIVYALWQWQSILQNQRNSGHQRIPTKWPKLTKVTLTQQCNNGTMLRCVVNCQQVHCCFFVGRRWFHQSLKSDSKWPAHNNQYIQHNSNKFKNSKHNNWYCACRGGGYVKSMPYFDGLHLAVFFDHFFVPTKFEKRTNTCAKNMQKPKCESTRIFFFETP